MKKLITLISILFLISIPSLGRDILDTIPKKINLPEAVAKETVKDLLRGDSAVGELNLTKQNLEFEKTKSKAKDSIISILNQEIGVYKEKEKSFNDIIFFKDSQLDLEQQVSKKLAADLRAVKRKKTFMQIAGTAIIGGLAYLYITK